MRMYRFDPYLKDREQKARERVMRAREYWKFHSPDKVDRDRDIRIQRKREVALRAKRIKVTLPIVGLALLFMYPQPVDARCYSVWHYKTPQHCGGVYARAKPHMVMNVDPPDPKPMALPAVDQIDQRTPQDIADQKEHDAAVKAHHDEINGLMILLHAEEDAAHAMGVDR